MNSTLAARDLVLIGAGHTNMHIVRMFRMKPIPGVKLTLISPGGIASYSGMLPGTLAGQYESDDMSIDLFRFTAGTGIRLIADPAIGLDPDKRRVLFNDRPPIRYDILSIGVGSIPANRDIWIDNPDVLSIKPMTTFLQRFESRLQSVIESKAGKTVRIAVVGGGAAGTEVAMCLDARFKKSGVDASIGLFDAGQNILKGYLEETVMLAKRECAQRGVVIHSNRRAVGLADGQLQFTDQTTVPADIVIWAAAAAAPPGLEKFNLPQTDKGFLAVRQTLQTTADYPVFVVGDTATIESNPIRKAGVYAVRQGPVLWDNIKHLLAGEPLEEFKPQDDFLSLIATGDGRALGQYKGRSFLNSMAWRWKDYIDRKFMRMYQDYTPPRMSAPANPDAMPEMKCQGCGGKVGSGVLSAALEQLDIADHADVLQGLGDPDDAAILKTDRPINVVSTDFFTAFMDDPYIVGRVAALNALSDLWATGADPVGAMAMVSLLEGEPRQQTDLLYQLLAGGVHELTKAGASLLGGHTIETADLTIGYTVMGRTDGNVPFRKANLKAGDQLILTKPMGTGVILAAHMRGLARAEWMNALLKSMVISNAAASTTARKFKLTAVTDVTGFGLAKHLHEMLDASGMNATIELNKLPLLPGTVDLIAADVRSTLDPANREVEPFVDCGVPTIERPEYAALFDPQTSGGLLLSVPAADVDSVLKDLNTAGLEHACLVGEVTTASDQPMLKVVD